MSPELAQPAPFSTDLPTATVSEARRRACKENSQKSTGPRDCAETRRNAYDHGLTAKMALPPEELRLIGLRYEAYKESFQPETPFQLDKCEQAAHGAHRRKRAQIFGAKARRRLENRTRAEYDEDRLAAIRRLAERLPKRPERVAAELKRSAPGCGYLLERWEALERRLDESGRWTAERIGESYDLRGVPTADRVADASLPLGDREAMLRLIRQEQADLRARRAGLEAREDRLYEESREGMGLEEEPEIKLYRRYEREGYRQEQQAIAELLADQDRLKTFATPAATPPAPEPETEPGPEPEPEPTAPVVEAASPAPAPALFPREVDESSAERTDAEIEADLDALTEWLMAQIVMPPPATGPDSSAEQE